MQWLIYICLIERLVITMRNICDNTKMTGLILLISLQLHLLLLVLLDYPVSQSPKHALMLQNMRYNFLGSGSAWKRRSISYFAKR